MLCAASQTWASPPAERDTATALVHSQLVRPLSERDSRRSRFSRARPAPTARRVRILDEAPLVDATGAAFFRFAIDTRRGYFDADDQGTWTKNAEVGCVYPERQGVYVRVGDRHYPVAFLLGERPEPAEPHVCQPKP